jgi:hypothetical protein
VNQGEDFTPSIVVNDLDDERGRIIVLRTRFIDIPIIYTNTDRTLFLIHRNKIGYPISQSQRIDKVSFKKFFNFKIDSNDFTWMDWEKSLLNRFSIWICLNLMHNDIKINTWNFFITPGKNVMEFLKKGFIGANLITRT